MMRRRTFLGAGIGIAGAASFKASAAPILSADNYGLEPSAAKRRNAWIEVDAGAFETNIDRVRALIGSSQLCAVMKADAYGNSLALLMPSVIKKDIGVVAITSNDEARVAREMGYEGRLIRIRAATPDEIADSLPLFVEELVGNSRTAGALQRLMEREAGARHLAIHLSLNSGGMSRDGLELSSDHGKADARALLAFDKLLLKGVMTHYPSEEENDILGQLRRFGDDTAWLAQQGLAIDRLTRHTANSFTTLRYPQTRLDMVRVGGLLYGDPGSVKTDAFLPTMTVKSRIAAIGHYPADQTVNYDRTYRLERDSWLANIPLGYSDGYRRGFGHANRPEFPAETRNRTEVLIGGRRFPVVGRITMNAMMVDVTDGLDRVSVGDEIVLFGRQGNEIITQAELETNSAAYGPEILGMLGAAVPRILNAP